MATASQTLDMGKLMVVAAAHKAICESEAHEVTTVLNALPNISSVNISDVCNGQKLLITAIKTGKLLQVLQSSLLGTIDLGQPQGPAVTNFVIQQLGIESFWKLKELELADGSKRLIGDMPVSKIYDCAPTNQNFISIATEKHQLAEFLEGGSGTIAIDAPVTSTDVQLLDPSLAAKALVHKQFKALDESVKVTGTISLASEVGVKCAYYSVIMNYPPQLKTFVASNKTTDKLDINAMVDTSSVAQGMRIPTIQHSLISYAALHNCVGEFLDSIKDADKDAGSTLDLGVQAPDGKLIVEKLHNKDKEAVLHYATTERLHITCTPAEIKKVEAKLTSFEFGDMYFRMQFRVPNDAAKIAAGEGTDKILMTATSKDEILGHVYAVKVKDLTNTTQKALHTLLQLAGEHHKDIFCFLEPSPEPEQITVEKLMSNGHTEIEARQFLGHWEGFAGALPE